MRSYNRRHLVFQLGVFALALAACSGAFSAWYLAVPPLLLGGVGGAVVVRSLVRDWGRYWAAQDVVWLWDHDELT